MEKHFEFTDETAVDFSGNVLHRIRCTRDIPGVKKGTLGGWVGKKENLSGDAWVFGNAQVFGNAHVFDSAWVFDNAQVYGNAQVFGNARVYGNAQVLSDAWVSGNAQVRANAHVFENAQVSGNAHVYDNARVYGNAWVRDDAWVYGSAWLSGDARVHNHADYCCFQSFGRDGRTTTASRDAECGVRIVCGCFSGTLEEFEKRVEETHGNSQYGLEYKAVINVLRVKFNL